MFEIFYHTRHCKITKIFAYECPPFDSKSQMQVFAWQQADWIHSPRAREYDEASLSVQIFSHHFAGLFLIFIFLSYFMIMKTAYAPEWECEFQFSDIFFTLIVVLTSFGLDYWT
jgi:hypothetical protein